MKINASKNLFMLIMMLSTIMTMSSNNMLMTWIALEINMISIMPILTKSKKSTDQPMKYFIIQSTSSSLMLMSIMLNSITEESPTSSIILMTSMLMKMGMMPFHLWFPPLMNKMTWENCLILSTIQKIPPTIIMTQMMNIKTMLIPMAISSFMGPISALKQLSMKKIMAYSSISNSTWLISSLYLSKQMFLMFFLTYSTLTMMMMSKMNKNNILYMNQVTTMSYMKKLSLSITMLSMSGMPPLLGFLPKWMILQNLIKFSTILPMMMILSSILATFIYIKMTNPMMTNLTMMKKTKKEKKSKNYETIINLLGIPMMMTLKCL
uniref:NADH dehydrogenase subunit 2 n=1 Tax=Gergithus yunnanensis TaxID=1898278 RepID=UPI002E78D041|nr:NADH dehydrogenase subunit 2 [Gergithus yunnanensis]WQB38530.1 NADH dehydrogenase subunit 2 [Gergithus yunnanensis]